jgi:DNA recombination protein RmuC
MSLVLAVLLAVLAGAAISAVVFYLVFFAQRKNETADRAQQREELRSLLDLAAQKLETERVKQNADMNAQRVDVAHTVDRLSEQLKAYEALVRQFEGERREKYGSLEKSLKDAAETTGRLANTTEGLRAMLDNSRARGQWGERMADDILRASGLQEGLQYQKNRTQDTSVTRPDFTFFMPDGHKLHMDVKFPLDNYMRMAAAPAPEEKARFKNEFLKDVRARIREIQRRDYVSTGEGTLDYVLLFIPNEQVYGFINEALPGFIDEALAQKVVLCSPFTLYAVLAVVRQAFENFHFAQSTQQILKLFGSFMDVYRKFQERFGKLGDELRKTQTAYDEIAETSFKRLDQAVAKLEKLSKGHLDVPQAKPGIASELLLPAAKERVED